MIEIRIVIKTETGIDQEASTRLHRRPLFMSVLFVIPSLKPIW